MPKDIMITKQNGGPDLSDHLICGHMLQMIDDENERRIDYRVQFKLDIIQRQVRRKILARNINLLKLLVALPERVRLLEKRNKSRKINRGLHDIMRNIELKQQHYDIPEGMMMEEAESIHRILKVRNKYKSDWSTESSFEVALRSACKRNGYYCASQVYIRSHPVDFVVFRDFKSVGAIARDRLGCNRLHVGGAADVAENAVLVEADDSTHHPANDEYRDLKHWDDFHLITRRFQAKAIRLDAPGEARKLMDYLKHDLGWKRR